MTLTPSKRRNPMKKSKVETKINLAADAQDIDIDPKQIAQVVTLARKQFKLASKIADTQASLNKMVEEFTELQETTLPDLMQEIGLEELRLSDKIALTIKKTLYASVPVAKMPRAIAWLKKRDWDSIVKYDASISFGKGEDKKMEVFQKIFEQRKLLKDVPYKMKMSIHPQTLKAFVNEQRARGMEFPSTIFNIHEIRKAIIQ